MESTGGRSSGTAAVAEAFDSTTHEEGSMSAPSEDQILEKAKELCRCEVRLGT
jgi:hypothetical protein